VPAADLAIRIVIIQINPLIMNHIVLLGDSVFDNAAYIDGGPDVGTQLRAALPSGWQSTVLARDGSVTRDVASQLDALPSAATHLVVCVGGNDALIEAPVLTHPVSTVAMAMERMSLVARRFEASYRAMLAAVLRESAPAAVCTIYEPRFPDPLMQLQTCAALRHFNDALLRIAFEFRVPVLDLRLVCTDDACYANPIEPSIIGGRRIAAAILNLVSQHDFSSARTTVFGPAHAVAT
jgi:lysophospholipase L1-like esterase